MTIQKRISQFDFELEMRKLDFFKLVRRYKATKGSILECKMYNVDSGVYFNSLFVRRSQLLVLIHEEMEQLRSIDPVFVNRIKL